MPAVAFDNPQNYNHQAKRYAESLDNAVWTNQFDNTANREAHILTTGPEIWEQTNGGNLDAFICATGTGGTLAGVTRYLTEKSNGRVQGWLADPPGSVLYNLVENGKIAREGNGSITEGKSQCDTYRYESVLMIRYRTGSSYQQPQGRYLPPYWRHPRARFRLDQHGLPVIARGGYLRRRFIGFECLGGFGAGEEAGQGEDDRDDFV